MCGIRAFVSRHHDTMTRGVAGEKGRELCFKAADFGQGVAHTRFLGDGSGRAAVLCIVYVPPIVHDHDGPFPGAAHGQRDNGQNQQRDRRWPDSCAARFIWHGGSIKNHGVGQRPARYSRRWGRSRKERASAGVFQPAQMSSRPSTRIAGGASSRTSQMVTVSSRLSNLLDPRHPSSRVAGRMKSWSSSASSREAASRAVSPGFMNPPGSV